MKMIHSLTKRQILIFSLILILLIGGWIIWKSMASKISSIKPISREKIWITTNPQIAKDFSSIKLTGKVKSNKFAIVAPRRMGIIQDLLVDIGDTISKGQTIGYLFPEGVEGQGSAAIGSAGAQLAKARAELAQARGVAINSVSVATKQWRESQVQLQTRSNLDEDSIRQLSEKKGEASILATNVWENAKTILFGPQGVESNRGVVGNFNSALLQNKVRNSGYEIYQMENSGSWATQDKIIEHLVHLESFLSDAEKLYKKAIPSANNSIQKITANQKSIQASQIQVSQIKQQILGLEEKNNQSSSVEIEKEVAVEKSNEILDLVQSQQGLSVTKAEQNVDVAYANYNAALIKAGHQKIIAPFGGTVSARMVEVGQAVTPNTVLFYMEDVETNRAGTENYEVHISIPESWTGKVSVGDSVGIKRSGTGEILEGRIFRLSDQINLRTGMMMATVAVIPPIIEIFEKDQEENKDEETIDEILLEQKEINLIHGQTVFVYLEDQEASLFSVPTLSLKKRGIDYFLWKMNNKNPVKLQVEVVAEDGEFSQIFTKELTVEDSIITNPSVSLFRTE